MTDNWWDGFVLPICVRNSAVENLFFIKLLLHYCWITPKRVTSWQGPLRRNLAAGPITPIEKLLHYAEACYELAGPISASLRLRALGNTASCEEISTLATLSPIWPRFECQIFYSSDKRLAARTTIVGAIKSLLQTKIMPFTKTNKVQKPMKNKMKE